MIIAAFVGWLRVAALDGSLPALFVTGAIAAGVFGVVNISAMLRSWGKRPARAIQA